MQASFQKGSIVATPVSTTVNGTQTLTVTPFILNVISNIGFSSSGYISVVTTSGITIVQYTGLGTNTFNGCTATNTYTSNDTSAVTSTYTVNNLPFMNNGSISGSDVLYPPSTPANWTSLPTTASGGLDLIIGGVLTKLGTITSGTWNAGIITGTYGGSGVNNGSNTVTLGGNLSTGGPLAITGTVASGQVLKGTGSGTASWQVLNGYTTTVTAAGTTTLTTASTYQQYFTGTSTQTVVLPANSTVGNQFSITNLSTGLVTVTASGGNILSILQPGSGIGGSTNILTCIVTNGTDFTAWRGGNVETFTVGTGPVGTCFDGTNIWITNYNSNTVSKIVAATGVTAGTFATGAGPQPIAYDGTNIWIGNGNTNTITKLLASSGAVLGTFTVGNTPQGICFDGTNIWVTNRTSDNVSKLLASTGATIGTYTAGTGPHGICFDGVYIWVANNGSANVTKLLAATGAVIGTYSVGTSPRGICFDGTNIWIANFGSNNMTKLLASTGATVGTYSVGTQPIGVCFDGTNIWIANFGSNNMTKLLASTGAALGTYLTGAGSQYLCFDGSNIWIANFTDNNINKFVQPGIVPSNNIQTEPIGVPLLSTFDNIQRDLYANTTVNNLITGYQTVVTAAGTTTLSIISQYQWYFTGSTTQTVILPAPNTLPVGFEFELVNQSSGAITIRTNSNPVTITGATTGVNPTVYTASNAYAVGQIITITGVTPVAYNLTSVAISAVSNPGGISTTFSVATTVTGPYVSGGTATVDTLTVATLAALGSTGGWALLTCIDNTGVTGVGGWSSEGGGIVVL